MRTAPLFLQVFAIAASHPLEIISLEKTAAWLAEKGALETISHYLDLLHEAFLVTPLQKFSNSEIRRRRSSPKLVVRNNALLVAGGMNPPDVATEPERWGRWVENACLTRAVNDGLDLNFWREEQWLQMGGNDICWRSKRVAALWRICGVWVMPPKSFQSVGLLFYATQAVSEWQSRLVMKLLYG